MSNQVRDWREKNYERHLFQSRVDSTKYRIRCELNSITPNIHTLQGLFKLLEKHEHNLKAWKTETKTYFQNKRTSTKYR